MRQDTLLFLSRHASGRKTHPFTAKLDLFNFDIMQYNPRFQLPIRSLFLSIMAALSRAHGSDLDGSVTGLPQINKARAFDNLPPAHTPNNLLKLLTQTLLWLGGFAVWVILIIHFFSSLINHNIR